MQAKVVFANAEEEKANRRVRYFRQTYMDSRCLLVPLPKGDARRERYPTIFSDEGCPYLSWVGAADVSKPATFKRCGFTSVIQN